MPLLHLILVFAVAIVFVMVVVAATAFVTLVIDRSRSHLRRRPMSKPDSYSPVGVRICDGAEGVADTPVLEARENRLMRPSCWSVGRGVRGRRSES